MAVALQRAAHQIVDEPKVFDDGFAVRILGDEMRPLLQTFISDSKRDLASVSSRAFLVARSRYTEDHIARAIERGVTQCVILGAGLDTFAYRCTYDGLRIFEVDHPATQAWKRNLLRDARIDVPTSVVFTPVDFSQTSVEVELLESGWDPTKPSFISWLGVVSYLTHDTVMAMLKFTASLPAGSEIVFDYVIAPHLMTAEQRRWFDWLNPRIGAEGEPFQTFFDPAALVQEMKLMGFMQVADVSPEGLNALYFSARSDNLKTTTTLSHMMRARLG